MEEQQQPPPPAETAVADATAAEETEAAEAAGAPLPNETIESLIAFASTAQPPAAQPPAEEPNDTATPAPATQPAEQQQQQQVLQLLPPFIQNLRNCFKMLTDQQFESEVETERVRRLYEPNNLAKLPPAAAAAAATEEANKKRAPQTEGGVAEENDDENNKKQKTATDASNLALPGGTQATTAAATGQQAQAPYPYPHPLPAAHAYPYPAPYQYPIYPHYPAAVHAPPPPPPPHAATTTTAAAAAAAAATPQKKTTKRAAPAAATTGNTITTTAATADGTTKTKKKRKRGPNKMPTKPRANHAKFWNEQYEKLLNFKQDFGHVVIPNKKEWSSLYNWVRKNKDKWTRVLEGDEKSAILLSQEQIDKLIAVGLGTAEKGPTNFSQSAIEAEWEARFAELKSFKNEYGHVNVSDFIHKDTPYHKLGIWCINQRKNFQNRQNVAKTGKKKFSKNGVMTEEQLLKFAAIGFRFAHKLQDFDERCVQMQEFIKEHGTTRVPPHYTGMGNLGAWVKKVKDQYHAGKLAPERVAKLDALEFDWSRQPKSSTIHHGEQNHPQMELVAAPAAAAAAVAAAVRNRHPQAQQSPW